MEFLIKFAQTHETFRLAEIEALAVLEDVDMTILEYSVESPFCIARLPTVAAARATLDQLNQSVKDRTSCKWAEFKDSSFKFAVDSYQGARSNSQRLAVINSFAYLPFDGPIRMSKPDETFTIFEQWPFNSVPLAIEHPDWLYLGRFVADSSRDAILKFDLKKRGYISTTSMDSELSLVTANISLAGPGKLFYDPFVGTGSFPVACAYFGAMGWGSDIDGRSIRGEGGDKSLLGNFKQYNLESCLGDVFSADLINTPIRRDMRIWDGIVCDPPYGVREGLRVLGVRDPEKTPWVVEKGIQLASSPDFVPPKKPYSFFAMLDDILEFAANTLVDDGRLSFWMPTANDEQQEISVPSHPSLEIVSICVQVFNKCVPRRHRFKLTTIAGSRRLITYRRLRDDQVSQAALHSHRAKEPPSQGVTADELNPFRRGYFRRFEANQQ